MYRLALLALSLMFVAAPAHAAPVACNQFQSGSAPPAGYGASWNVLSSGRELLISASCDFSEEITTYQVGSGASNQYVYKTRYYFGITTKQWWPTTLEGTFAQGSTDWLAGKGTLEGGIPNIGTFYWVGYVCQWNGTEWKCGCRDAACAINYWNLQAVHNPFFEEPGTTTGGGTTGGSTTGGTTGGPVGSGSSIPAATRTINVSGSSQLSSALSNAQAGDHIVLASGSYSAITISRSGASGRPIVVRAATLHGPKFSGPITVNGNYVWVMGMDMGSRGITANGSNIRISRNIFRSSVGPAISASKPSRRVEIDHNEHAGGTITSGANNGASPIYMRFECHETGDHYIHHNYIHDGSGGDGVSESIMVGFGVVCDSRLHSPPDAGVLVEYNLISNWRAGYCLRTKSGDATFRFNTCLGGGKGSQSRHGDNVRWIANWFEGNGNIRIFGSNHQIIGNRAVGSDTIWVPAGNIYSNEPFENGYHAALDTIVAGNSGNLQIGGHVGNYNQSPAKNTRVEAHQSGNGCGQGNITCLNHTGTTFSANTSRTIPQAIKLTPAQVGPNAPTAPR